MNSQSSISQFQCFIAQTQNLHHSPVIKYKPHPLTHQPISDGIIVQYDPTHPQEQRGSEVQ